MEEYITFTPPPERKCGFTLAEVLITLAIIGVVAALTIPTVVKNYQKQQYYTGFMKAYNTLNKAVQRSIAENGNVESWNLEASWATPINIKFNEYIVPYLSIAKKCPAQEASMAPCFAAVYHDLYGNTVDNSDDISHNTHYYDKYILADGMSVQVRSVRPDTTSVSGVITVWVDINGPKKPNIYGRDTFQFSLYAQNNSFAPFGLYEYNETLRKFVKREDSNIQSSCKGATATSGIRCGGKLLLEGKMNY